MRLSILIAGAFLTALPLQGYAQSFNEDAGWQLTVGAGALYQPAYRGADDYVVRPVPDIRLSYGNRFSASVEDGVRLNVLPNGALSAGPMLSTHFGRLEDAGDDNDLVGMGDIDATLEVGGFVTYQVDQLSVGLELRQGVAGGHDGLYGEAEIKFQGSLPMLGQHARFSIGPEIAFGDEVYNSTFFGVSAAQSAASGISQFDAGGGVISYGLHAAAVVPLGRRTSMIGFLGYDILAGDAGDSTIVSERGAEDQGFAGLVLQYSF